MGVAAITAGVLIGSTVLGGIMSDKASQEAEESAAKASQDQIRELERQAADTRESAQESRSDRVRDADREFAALQVASVEGGGLGTVSLARLSGDIGAAEGRDISRTNRSEKSQLAALQSQAVGVRRGFKAYAKEAKASRTMAGHKTLFSGLTIGGNYARGAYNTTGTTGKAGSSGSSTGK